MSDLNAVDASEADFNKVVIEESRQRLVLVDFWAPWCGPCRSLTPIIEKLAEEYAGRFLLARVNSDDNQALAGQFGVRSIPNVKAFSDGEMVDEFLGAVPESAVREFIDRLLPSPAELKRRAAMNLYSSDGDADAALQALQGAQADESDNDNIRIDRATILADIGRSEDASQLLEELAPVASMDSRVEHLKAKLTFADANTNDESTDSLEAQVLEDASDLALRLRLAKRYVAEKNYESALKHLIEIVRTDRAFGDDAGRKTILAVFEILGGDHHLTAQYRRILAATIN